VYSNLKCIHSKCILCDSAYCFSPYAHLLQTQI